MGSKGRAKWLRHVISWKVSCVNTARKKEWQWPTAWKLWASIWERGSRGWEQKNKREERRGRWDSRLSRRIKYFRRAAWRWVSRSCWERAWCQQGLGVFMQWDSSHGKVENEETDGSSSGQKEYNRPLLVHGSMWPRSRGGTFHFGHSVLGWRSLNGKIASWTKRSLDETGSRSSDVETGKRTCRSSDVRDPWSGYQVASVAHLDIWKRQKHRYEICLPKRCEEHVSAVGQDGLFMPSQKKWLDPSRCMSTTREKKMGYGEDRECIRPKAGNADLWIKVWEELHRLAARDILVELEHVKAHRTKKDKRCRTLRGLSLKATRRRMSWKSSSNVGRRIYGGSETKDNAARKRRGVCSSAVCSQLSLFGVGMERLWRAQAEAKRKVEFRGSEKREDKTSNGVSVHEVWKRQQVHEDAEKMHRTKILVGIFLENGKASPWRSWFGKKNG